MKHLKQEKEKWNYTIGKYVEPTLHVSPGEKIIVDTPDTAGNCIKNEEDIKILSQLEVFNPIVGPIFVDGAEKGDTIVIDINNIEPIFGQGWGGKFPAMVSTAGDAHRGLYLIGIEPAQYTLKICKIENNTVEIPLCNKKAIYTPYKPFIGTLGVAPERESVNNLVAGNYGGNMDNQDVRPGCKLLLPVFVEGAFLYLGDVHALQGDGELNGAPIEIAARCTITIDLIKNKIINWPRIESPEFIITVGSSCPIDNSLRIATTEMIYLLKNEHGFNLDDAAYLSNVLFRNRIDQAVNPFFSTVSVMFPKKYL